MKERLLERYEELRKVALEGIQERANLEPDREQRTVFMQGVLTAFQYLDCLEELIDAVLLEESEFKN